MALTPTWREFGFTLMVFSLIMSKFDAPPTFRDDDTNMRRFRVISFWTLLVLLVFMLLFLLARGASNPNPTSKTNASNTNGLVSGK